MTSKLSSVMLYQHHHTVHVYLNPYEEWTSIRWQVPHHVLKQFLPIKREPWFYDHGSHSRSALVPCGQHVSV